MLIAGPCGTGKSHLALSNGHAAVRQGHDVLFTTQTQLLGSLQAARAMGTYDRHFQTLVRTPLLIIDDLGLKPLRSPQDEDFHDLIAERHERFAPPLVTSNLDFTEWAAAFPNRLLGAATTDRLRHNAYQLILDGKSYRSPKPAPTGTQCSWCSSEIGRQGSTPQGRLELGGLDLALKVVNYLRNIAFGLARFRVCGSGALGS